ncbi:hypothetical protein [Brevibacterium samyangense]|uniref:Uncharacterized protein n=1 Tax=Brevibacterium samyangense TaxID=366888 RepID=A0ABN2T656_9MICO
MTAVTTADTSALDRNYTRTTTVWGNATLFAGFLLATYLPFHVLLFTDVPVTFAQILTAFIAVAAAYGVFWFVEPITYFPILGPAGMYQAFMIGNISNKLLPAAIVAQSTIGAKPGTKKASYAATAAICGAAFVHVVSMLVFVGILGSWIVTILPPPVTAIAQSYILPAILGGVVVQLIGTVKNLKSTFVAIVVGIVVVFAIMPFVPVVVQGFKIAICVVLTVVVVWFTRNKQERVDEDDEVFIN